MDEDEVLIDFGEEKYRASDDFEGIARRVIKENPEFTQLRTGAVRIAYQICASHRKKGGGIVYADTEKVKDKIKQFMPYDFIITVYPEGQELDAEHRYRLMYHELLHVGFEPESNKFSILPHDCEDFRSCMAKWGSDWVVS